jgi:hypothetical protein
MKRSTVRKGHGDLALLASRRAPRGFKSLVEACEHCAGAIKKGAASVSQFNAARLATEQLHINFPLDGLDLSTERRLLHAEPLGCPRYVTFLSDGDDITKMP